jgi:hypothetical protein
MALKEESYTILLDICDLNSIKLRMCYYIIIGRKAIINDSSFVDI